MIQEGTSGAEGKQKGIERKDLVLKRRRQRKLKRILSSKAHWKKNKARRPYARQGHKGIISANRNGLELPSARELRKIICSKRNTKRKIHTGSTDIYFVSYISYRTSLASEKREDRFQPTFRSSGGKIPHSKRNLKRKSRKGSTDVYLLKRTIELEID